MRRPRKESEKETRRKESAVKKAYWIEYRTKHADELTTCKKCGSVLALKDFCASYNFRYVCKQCICSQMRKWRNEHPLANNITSKRSFIKSAELIKSKKHTTCKICGDSFPPCAMDFHHISKKTIMVSKLYQKSIDRLENEINKCVLICANCHRNLTHKHEHKLQVLKNRNFKPELVEAPVKHGCQIKTCSQCHEIKNEENFTLLKTGYRHSFCKKCLREKNNQYSKISRQTRLMKPGKAYIIDQKDDKECQDCKKTFKYWVLDFDHIGTDKLAGISRLQNHSLNTIKQEIAKCELVCVCCHRIRTFNRKETRGIELPLVSMLIDMKSVHIQQCERTDEYCKKLLNKYHYAKFGRAATIIYKAIFNDVVIAIAKFAPVVRKEVATSEGHSHLEVLELDRFLIIPGVQTKNLGSKILSMIIKDIKQTKPNISALVSFADPNQGHTGTLYKAANWQYVGTSSCSYIYEQDDGQEINKKTLYNKAKHRGFKEKEYAMLLELNKIKTPGKHKFIYRLK